MVEIYDISIRRWTCADGCSFDYCDLCAAAGPRVVLTALKAASPRGHDECVDVLIEHGAATEEEAKHWGSMRCALQAPLDDAGDDL